MKTICERDVVKYLVEEVEKRGGEVRKVKWIGRVNAPDLRVLLGRGVWVEAKRPGKHATAAQRREHDRMRQHSERVTVIASFDGVDDFIREHLNGNTPRQRYA